MNATKDLVKLVKEIREKTGAGIVDIKNALKETDCDIDAAIDIIECSKKQKPKKEVGYTAVFSYNHNNKIASHVVVGCNTDFVGNMQEFKELGKNIAQQIVGTDPKCVEDLLEESFVKNPKIKIKDMLEEMSRKTQEDITVRSFDRVEI